MLTIPQARVIAHRICAQILKQETSGGIEALNRMSEDDAIKVREEIAKIIDMLVPMDAAIRQAKSQKK
jgi:hypothetical protein